MWFTLLLLTVVLLQALKTLANSNELLKDTFSPLSLGEG